MSIIPDGHGNEGLCTVRSDGGRRDLWRWVIVVRVAGVWHEDEDDDKLEGEAATLAEAKEAAAKAVPLACAFGPPSAR